MRKKPSVIRIQAGVSGRYIRAIFPAKSGIACGQIVDVFGHQARLLRCVDRRLEEDAWTFSFDLESGLSGTSSTVADLARYRVERTFDFHPNIDRTDIDACCKCGRAMKGKEPLWIRVHAGGAMMVHRDDPAEDLGGDAADLGCWRLGSECAKRLPPALVFTMPVPEWGSKEHQ